MGSAFDAPRFFAAAPTREQAKRIYWNDLKRLVPAAAIRGKPSETELTIPLWHGGELFVFGMDKPERIEGAPVDGGILDEYANIKARAWGENVRPALSDRNAWCDLIGVPEGRNHYYDVYQTAVAEQMSGSTEWAAFTWHSADILPPSEIAAARRDLDALTFSQEYEASFVNFAGRAYYGFSDANKARLVPRYDPRGPLIFCLDFNVSPGVAAVVQSLRLAPDDAPVTGVIGEVWIEDNSTTEIVCRKLATDWGTHQGRVEVYGDATGGARGTAQVSGSDWDIAKRMLRGTFGDRVSFHVKSANPKERSRVNAVNTRCCAGDGTRRLFVDPSAAPHVVKDLEGVPTVDGGSGEIDKKKHPRLTHISDALGYYVEYRFPINAGSSSVSSFAIG